MLLRPYLPLLALLAACDKTESTDLADLQAQIDKLSEASSPDDIAAAIEANLHVLLELRQAIEDVEAVIASPNCA